MADEKTYKFKKLAKLKKKDKWAKWSPEELEDNEDQTMAFYRTVFTRPVDPATLAYVQGQGQNPMSYWNVWNDFFLIQGIPVVQWYAEDYQCWSSSVASDCCKPQYFQRPIFDIDGNPQPNPDANDMINENTEVLNLLDPAKRDSMKHMWFNGKKWKRCGNTLDTPGFVGMADGFSVFIHHIYCPPTFDGATIGGYMVLMAPDDTNKFDELDKDPAFPVGAAMKTAFTPKNMKEPYPMAPRTLNSTAFNFLDWINDFVQYKPE